MKTRQERMNKYKENSSKLTNLVKWLNRVDLFLGPIALYFYLFADQSFIQLILLFLFPVYIVFQISVFIVDAYLRIKNEHFMKLTKIVVILAVIAGIILYFVLPANQFLLYFGIPAILIVNGIRIFEQRKKGSST